MAASASTGRLGARRRPCVRSAAHPAHDIIEDPAAALFFLGWCWTRAGADVKELAEVDVLAAGHAAPARGPLLRVPGRGP